jgi:hypothetical protein
MALCHYERQRVTKRRKGPKRTPTVPLLDPIKPAAALSSELKQTWTFGEKLTLYGFVVTVVATIATMSGVWISHHDATSSVQQTQRAQFSLEGPYEWYDIRRPCRAFVDSKCHYYMVYANTGTLGAIDSMGAINMMAQPLDEAQPQFDAEHYTSQHPQPLSAGISTSQDFDPYRLVTLTLNKDALLSAVASGSLRLYLYGGVNYTDKTAIRHWRNYCYYLERDLSSWHTCPQGNTEDTNKP